MITSFKKFNESKGSYVGMHCSPKLFNDDYHGPITEEYFNYYETILKKISSKYPEAQKYLIKIDSLEDVLSLEDDSVDLIFEIQSFFSKNNLEWIFVAPEPLTKYGDNCYRVYFNNFQETYKISDELVDDATIYIYDSIKNRPILKEINF